jgi:hypothetical protein
MDQDIQGTIDRLWSGAGRSSRSRLAALTQRMAVGLASTSSDQTCEPPAAGWERWLDAMPLEFTGYTFRPGSEHLRTLACDENNELGWCPNAAVFVPLCLGLDEAEEVASQELARKGPRSSILGEQRLVVPVRVEARDVYDLRGIVTPEQARWVYDELYRGDGTANEAAWNLARSEPRCEGILLPMEPLTLFVFVDSFEDVIDEAGGPTSVIGSSTRLQNVLDFVRQLR